MSIMTRVTSSKVAEFWMNGNPAKNSNGQFYTPDGVTLYSYGAHYAVGRRIKGGLVLVNKDKVSLTTSKHCGYARRAIPANQLLEVEDLTNKLKLYDDGKITLQTLCREA